MPASFDIAAARLRRLTSRPRLARLALFATLASPLWAGAMHAQQPARVERGWRLDADGAVRIYNLWGSTRIVGWDRDSIAAVATLGPGDRLNGGGSPQGVKIVVEGPEEARAPGTVLVVRVPARARVWIKGAGAPVEVSGITGGVDVYTVGGDIRVTGSPRELSAEAMQGDVELAVTSPWVRAKTATGAVTLRGAVEDAGVVTVGGRVLVEATGIRRGRLESVSGDVRFTGSVDRDGSFTVETHSGAVELALASDAAAEFAITTIAAPIENRLTTRRPTASRQRGGEELHFATGEGGAQITVRSFKGRVQLRRR